jgi:long-chain acyl-CoA synthetase
VKKFRLIKKCFTVESGEMTLTLKLRRAVILHNYKELIDEMYDVPKNNVLGV